MSDKNLTPEEKELEDLLDLEHSTDLPSDIPDILSSAAKNYQTKDARINIRLSKTDLNQLKRRAAREGLPYQTMISSILHKVANGLLDKTVRD